MSQKISPKLISLTFGILVICFAVGFYIFAWVEPPGEAPTENVPAPLNTSNIEQIKVGGLILNTGGAEVGFAVDQGKVGIGTLNPQAQLDIEINPSSTNNVEEMLRLTRTSEGVAQTGMGSSINFWLEVGPGTGGGGPFLTAKIENVLAQDADLNADLVFYMWSGATFQEAMRLHQTGMYVEGSVWTKGRVFIKDPLSIYSMSIKPGGTAMTLTRALTIDMNNADRTLDLTGNATLNQDVSTAGSPTFGNITIDGTVGEGQAFIDFQGTSSASYDDNISTNQGDGGSSGPKSPGAEQDGWAFEGMIQVEINGNKRWMPFYSEDACGC